MIEQKKQDLILGFHSDLDLQKKKSLLQKLVSPSSIQATNSQVKAVATVILETLDKELADKEKKSTINQEENEPCQQETKETAKEEKPLDKQQNTKYYCAIDEKDLNKVELAYFRRPTNSVILSDKDANRLMKGQDVPFLHGDKLVLQGFKVQLNGTSPDYLYDNFSFQENDKQQESNNVGGELQEAEGGSNQSDAAGDKLANGNGGPQYRRLSNALSGGASGSRRTLKGSNSKNKNGKKIIGQKRNFEMSDLSSSGDQDSQNAESDSQNSGGYVQNSKFKIPPQDNKKLYCICQQEYKNGNLMFQCEGPCEQWYHPKCMGVPDHMIETLQNTEETWICNFCQSNITQMNQGTLSQQIEPTIKKKKKTLSNSKQLTQ